MIWFDLILERTLLDHSEKLSYLAEYSYSLAIKVTITVASTYAKYLPSTYIVLPGSEMASGPTLHASRCSCSEFKINLS